jgi:hypothetical protein
MPVLLLREHHHSAATWVWIYSVLSHHTRREGCPKNYRQHGEEQPEKETQI